MKPIYKICWTLAKLAGKGYFKLEIKGQENLLSLKDGGAIIAANHQSYLDPPLISASYPEEIHFLARETLFRGRFGSLISRLNAVPINQDGADLSSIKTIIKEVKKGNRVLVFPEGTRTQDGEIHGAAAGVGMIVAKSKGLVQPVRIEGAYDAWKKGEKNIKRVPITITIGKPLDFSHIGKVKSKEEYQQIADTIMENIKAL